jgi:hypothetical protein
MGAEIGPHRDDPGPCDGKIVAAGLFPALDGARGCSHNGPHERPFRYLRHLPEDYSLAHSWLRPSFLPFETKRTPGQQAGVSSWN